MTKADVPKVEAPIVSDAVEVVKHKSLDAAFVAFQAEAEPIARASTGQSGNRTYNYAEAAAIIKAVRPILAKHQLAVRQPINYRDGDYYLKTILLHASGQKAESEVKLIAKDGTPQGFGSGVTYMRRYTYMAELGLVAEGEDDDGAKAQAEAGGQKQTAPARPVGPPRATSTQINYIHQLAADLGVTDDTVESWALHKPKSKQWAETLIQGLKQKLSAKEKAERDAAAKAADEAETEDVVIEDISDEPVDLSELNI